MKHFKWRFSKIQNSRALMGRTTQIIPLTVWGEALTINKYNYNQSKSFKIILHNYENKQNAE